MVFVKREFEWRKKVPVSLKNNITIYILMVFVMFFFFTTNVYAITGSSENISLNSQIGTISYDAKILDLNAYGGSATIDGLFNSSTVDGRLGLLTNLDSDINMTLTLSSPSNNIIVIGSVVTFNYLPSGLIDNCSLYIDGVLKGYDSDPYLDMINSFTISGISVGKHTWNVTCKSDSSQLMVSRNFTTILYSGFNSSSTSLDGIDPSAIANLTLSKSFGQIVFDGYTDLSDGVDLISNVIISSRSISINSVGAPMLNKSATLTLNDIPFNNIVILRDGAVCTDCSIISLANNQLVFNVTGFSTYTVTSTSKLETFDTTDYSIIKQNQSVIFSANYTNLTSGNPIISACNISVDGMGIFAMNYNLTSQLHEYNLSLENAGIIPYTIQCVPIESGFDSLELNSTCIIQGVSLTSFSDTTVQVGPSSSMNVTSDSVIIDAQASNLTELSFDAQFVTNTWQGYYGSLVGKIRLVDGNSSVLYNWDLVSPSGEVYAVRSPSVNWNDIRCANITELEAEDVALGVPINADDSVVNTFVNTSSFNTFFTGTVQITSNQNCYSTHLNDNTGAQSTRYAEILLSDSNLIIYTALLDPGTIGFDGNAHDFELLVGENGHNDDSNPTMYYFYIELG
jgi:hypothetical protein